MLRNWVGGCSRIAFLWLAMMFVATSSGFGRDLFYHIWHNGHLVVPTFLGYCGGYIFGPDRGSDDDEPLPPPRPSELGKSLLLIQFQTYRGKPLVIGETLFIRPLPVDGSYYLGGGFSGEVIGKIIRTSSYFRATVRIRQGSAAAPGVVITGTVESRLSKSPKKDKYNMVTYREQNRFHGTISDPSFLGIKHQMFTQRVTQFYRGFDLD